MAIVGATMQIAFWSIVIPTALWILIKLFGELFYGIGIMLFNVMDMLQSTFRKLAGLGNVWVEGQETGDILTAIMKNDVIIDVLLSVAIFALGLVILGSIVQIVRLEYTTEGSKNSKEKVFTTALKSLLMMALIPIVCFVGIRLSNYLLQAVDYATSSSGASTVSGSVFVASTNEASTVYDTKNLKNGVNISDLLTSIFAKETYSNAIVESNGNQGYYIYGFKKWFNTTESDEAKARVRLTKQVAESFTSVSLNNNGLYEVGRVFDDGELGKGTNIIGNKLSYLNLTAVAYFYNCSNINYLILYLGCYICIKALFNASMGMIARIYKVVGLFVIAPAAIGLQPIDDGGAYKKWKGSFIQNVLSAYGVIVALNLYFMVVGVLQTVELWEGTLFYLPNSFMQFLFVLTGATMIKDLSALFGGLIGAADAMAEGEKTTAAVGQMAGSVMKVGMGAAQLGGAAFKGLGSFIAKHKGVTLDDGTRTSAAKEQKKVDAGKEAQSKFDEKYMKNEHGDIVNKDGSAITDVNEKNAAKDLDTKISEGKKAESEFRKKDSKLAKQSRKAASRAIGAGQSMSRFTDMAMNNGLTKSLNNLTGGAMDYLSGKAYKGVDEKYQKDLADNGVDVEEFAPKAGTSYLSRMSDKMVKNRTKSKSAKISKDSEGAQMLVQADGDAKTANESVKHIKELAKQETNELNKNIAKNDATRTQMKNTTAGIDSTVGYKSYGASDMAAWQQLLANRDKFLEGGNHAELKKYLDSVTDSSGTFKTGSGLENFNGNAVAQEFAKQLYNTMASYAPGTKNVADVRNDMRRDIANGVNVSGTMVKVDAENSASVLHDNVNDTSTYGKYSDRETYKALGDANDEMKQKRTDIANNIQKLETAHQTHGGLSRESLKEYAEAMTEDVGDIFKQANDRFAQAIKNLQDALSNKGIKANLNTEQKFKIDDQPILTALTKIKESQDAMAKELKDKKESGEANKTLQDILKALKK